MAARYSQMLPAHGRLKEWRALYDSAFRSPDDFFNAFTDRLPVLLTLAPNVAANLRASGNYEAANSIFRRTEPTIVQYAKNGPATPTMLEALAYYRAADGKGDEAVSLLNRAFAMGWLPQGPSDIAQEPCFAPFAARPDFKALRQHILARIAQERRKVSPVALASSGLGSKMAA
jgi:hypothetical protein